MRKNLVLALALALVVAGCSAFSEPDATAGWVGVGQTTDPPDDAVVINASEIDGPTYLEAAFENASKRANTSDSQVVRQLSETEFERLRQQFGAYERYNSSEAALTGYYVQYQGDIYRVVLEENETKSG